MMEKCFRHKLACGLVKGVIFYVFFNKFHYKLDIKYIFLVIIFNEYVFYLVPFIFYLN